MQTGWVRTSFQEGWEGMQVSLAEDRWEGNKSSSRRVRVERVPVNTDDTRRLWGTKTSQTLHSHKTKHRTKLCDQQIHSNRQKPVWFVSDGKVTCPELAVRSILVGLAAAGPEGQASFSPPETNKHHTLFIKGNRRRPRLCAISALMLLLQGCCVCSQADHSSGKHLQM